MGQHFGVIGIADSAGGGAKAGEHQDAIGRSNRDRCARQCIELCQSQCCGTNSEGGQAGGGGDGERAGRGAGRLGQRGVGGVGTTIGIGDGDDGSAIGVPVDGDD